MGLIDIPKSPRVVVIRESETTIPMSSLVPGSPGEVTIIDTLFVDVSPDGQTLTFVEIHAVISMDLEMIHLNESEGIRLV